MRKDYKAIEVTALYEISKLLSSSINLRTNLRGVLRVLSEYLEMRRGTVALRSGSEVSIIAAYGMSEEEIGRGTYRLGEGIIGRVAKHGSPVVIPDIETEPMFLNKTGARVNSKKEKVAFLCVPIKFKTEILGVLSVDRLFNHAAVSFEEDIKLLKIIASFIAQSIKLHRELEREREAFHEEREHLRHQLKGRYRIENMIGQSDQMQEVFETVHRVAPSRANVLLRGESGTGKELIAKAIHYMSPRAKGPFIKFNCASIPEGLLESELFGHEKGSFTGAAAMRKGRFELADTGTIFLDEIGDLPLSLQPKILRVLQEREFERVGGEKTISVNIRVIAATSRDLEGYVASRRFREDLYYRLNVVPVFIPPLQQRKEDIPLLVDYFLKKYNDENGKAATISPEVMKVLTLYLWPGNVRELENTIERLVVMASGNSVSLREVPAQIRDSSQKTATSSRPPDALPSTVADMEKQRIVDALVQSGWNQSRAARILGITPRQIGYKIKKYGIDEEKGHNRS
ncbi:MAG: nif-specific transcriptional activator NifA [Thermodesulfovibrio sp.]|nr:nif-specific transcriptional activator NifA [Thermodesulfovibrio sp.]